MPLSFAIVGFRHGHIYDLATRVNERPDLNLVAVCEEDEATREQVVGHGLCERVFTSYDELLANVDCDVIGVGDYFAKRGSIIIKALQHGKHIISDKPICTSLEELAIITDLVKSSGRRLGCQLDIRDSGNFRALRQIMRSGVLGEVRAIGFGGQHALLKATRPEWYFEPGKQGGTVNDIAVHAFDFIPWLTGLDFTTVNCARTWNAGLPETPHLQNAAHVMLTLKNGAGVLGDISYFSPDSHRNAIPQYWRTTVWGSRGVAETSYSAEGVSLHLDGEAVRILPAAEAAPGGYLDHFLADISGEIREDHLTTQGVLRVSRISLLAQQAADYSLCNLSLKEAA